MLGRFLEYSVPTQDIQASLDFYRRLKFSTVAVGEAWPHPYAVVTDGRIHIGLHQTVPTAPTETFVKPTLTFVKPDLIKCLPDAERVGLTLEYRHLGDHVFNEIGFIEPQGHALRLIEARAFSPSPRPSSEFPLCGYFEEIALPCADAAAAKDFWEMCGFVAMDEPHAALPHVSCTSDFIDIGLHDAKSLRSTALMFSHADLPALLAAAANAGVEPARAVPAPLTRQTAALFVAPEGTQVLVIADTG